METKLHLEILAQPDDFTCGPTCLHALYRFYGDELPLEQVIRETTRLEGGGTLSPLLGTHALRRGYEATIYTYDLQVFDPTWFVPGAPPLAEKLCAQLAVKDSPRFREVTEAYLEFLKLGGRIRMEDLTLGLVRKYLSRGAPVLAGLSATYLYRESREIDPVNQPDDIRGEPSGHFVVLCGYDRDARTALVADPLKPNPFSASHLYVASIDRVLCAILLGILTNDAKLLIVEPKKSERKQRADSDRRE
jgi:hypothetical protein